MDKPRKVYEGDEARKFWKESTKYHKFTDFGDEFANIGGWYEESPGLYVAYDFCNGSEVFIEEFTSQSEALKYASGEIATTKQGVEI